MYKKSIMKHIYTPEEIKYIVDNWNSSTVKAIAKHIGVTRSALSQKVIRMRDEGYDLPMKEMVRASVTAVGTRHTFRNGQVYEKMPDGSWKYVSREKKEKPVKLQTSAVRMSPVKREPQRKGIKQFNPAGKKLVRIDSKTLVYRNIAR